MLGLHPLSSEITIRKLLFLHKIISLPGDSICQLIFLRKLYLYLSGSTIAMGFIPDICQLLCEYNLQYILSGSWDIVRLPSKSQWKKHGKSMSKRPSILGILYYGDRGFIVTAILHDSANYTSLLLQLLSGKCHVRTVT